MPTTRSQGGDPPTTAKNHDADIHILKGKISKLGVDLPAYDKYEDFLVDSFEGKTFSEQIRGLTKQRIEILKAKNSISSIYVDFTTIYDRVIDEYREAPADGWIKTQMDALEKKDDITGLIESMKSHQIVLKNILIEIDETMKMVRELEGPSQNNIIEKPESQIVTKSRFELEALQIPSFDGRAENYPEFISVFNELINSNEELSNLHKSVYLKKALKGEAAKCIEGIPATGENYERLLNKIKSRYSNSLVNQHGILHKLENISKANDNSSSCEKTFNEIDIILNQLTSTGMDMFTSSDPMWQRIILRKFPERIAEKILLDSHDKRRFTINDMMNNLKKQLFSKQFLEESGFSESSQQKYAQSIIPHQISSMNDNHHHQQNIYRNNIPNSIHSGKDIGLSCIFCPTKSHITADCRIPIQEKKNFLNQFKLCWKCYRNDHVSYQCTMPNCSCGKQHNPDICRFSHQQRDQNNPHLQNNAQHNSANYQNRNIHTSAQNPHFGGHMALIESEEPHQFQGEAGENEKRLQTYHTVVNDEKSLPSLPILMTSSALAYNKSISRNVEASLFFDSGSNCTLISEKFAKDMQLKVISDKEYVLTGINGTGEKIKGQVVEILLKDQVGNNKVIKGLTKPLITDCLRTAELDIADLNYAKKNSISLSNAQFKGENICPDILIGADFYNQLVENQPRQILPSGLHVAATIFGSAIFGSRKESEENVSIPIVKLNKCDQKVNIPKKQKGRKIEKRNLFQKNIGLCKKAISIKQVDQCCDKLKNEKCIKITLSKEVLVLLKSRTASRSLKNRKRGRHNLKFKKVNPLRDIRTCLLGDDHCCQHTMSRIHRETILNDNENRLKNEQTSSCCVDQIQRTSHRLNEKVMQNKNANRDYGVLIQ